MTPIQHGRSEGIGVTFLMGLGLTLFVCMNPFLAVPRARVGLLNQNLNWESVKGIAFGSAFIIGFLLLSYFHEDIVAISMMMIAPFLLLVTFSQQAVLAPKTHKKVLLISRIGVSVGIVITAALILKATHII